MQIAIVTLKSFFVFFLNLVSQVLVLYKYMSSEGNLMSVPYVSKLKIQFANYMQYLPSFVKWEYIQISRIAWPMTDTS